MGILPGYTQPPQGAGGRKPVAGPWPSCCSFHPVTRLKILSQDTGSRCLVREMDINQSTTVLESTLAASWDARAEPASCSLVLTLGKIINFAMPGVSASVEQRLLKYLSLGVVLRMKQTNPQSTESIWVVWPLWIISCL